MGISSMISSNIDYNLVIQDLSVKMTIWDTVGQEKYADMNKTSIKEIGKLKDNEAMLFNMLEICFVNWICQNRNVLDNIDKCS